MNFFDSYFETGQVIDDLDARGEFYRALIDYYYTKEAPDFQHKEALIAFTACKVNLDNSRSKAESGRSGGSKRQAKPDSASADEDASAESKTEAKPDSASAKNAQNPGSKTQANGNGNGNSKERDSYESPKKAQRFSPPTLAEAKAYFTELGSPGEAEPFRDFYASKGWKVGSSPMKDWRAAARGWVRRASPPKPQAGKGVSGDDDMSAYFEAIESRAVVC